ncbi:MAG: oxygen-independent coproporphyrinogen III oxidase [Acetobacteraceae bacterium]|nr:oxygen-independent coproporphyrinogen III oxidase [Pseudomonadota bacterium]
MDNDTQVTLDKAPLSATSLASKYDANVPRYTSYPTAPHFHKGIGEADYRKWLAETDRQRPVSLYLHIPFCSQLCWYCGCNTRVVNSHRPVASYVDTLLKEIDLTAEAIGGPLKVEALHFGGGTPNILQPDDVDRIFATLRRHFTFTDNAEIAMEIDPRELTAEFVAAARRNGLNRASVGVQDIDEQVQNAINRQQPWAVTEGAIKLLRDANVPSVNVDLLYGLPYQTEASVRETMRRMIALQPDRIALFGYAHVPWMKPAQKLLPEDAMPDSPSRHAQQTAAASMLEDAGYVRIGLDHYARASDSMAKALAAGDVHRNFQGYTTDGAESLIGFGASAIGKLHGGYVQNMVAVVEWRAAVAAGKLPVHKGIALSEDDRLRGAIIEELMCSFRVDLGKFADRPGLLGDHLQTELQRLQTFVDDDLLVRNGMNLAVTEAGRPFVRSMAAVFDTYFGKSSARHSKGV